MSKNKKVEYIKNKYMIMQEYIFYKQKQKEKQCHKWMNEWIRKQKYKIAHKKCGKY